MDYQTSPGSNGTRTIIGPGFMVIDYDPMHPYGDGFDPPARRVYIGLRFDGSPIGVVRVLRDPATARTLAPTGWTHAG